VSDRPSFNYSIRTRVEFSETDAAAILYYGRWSHHVDRAIWGYRRQVGIDSLGPPGHKFVVRSYKAAFHGSARLDDELEAFARVSRMGRSSHTMEIRIESAEAALLFDAEIVLVGLDGYTDTPTATPIPEDLRARIAAFEGAALEQP
jgi:YbgC/YbaW family acyl-CoA thioester hydrolase